jgi:prepilin-type N-terminal cleavage/methylation domain-containing protein
MPRNHGFSLIELLAGVAIATTVIAAAGGLLSNAYRQGAANVNRGHAVVLAESELEELRALPDEELRKLRVRVLTGPAYRWNGIDYSILTDVVPDSPAANMTTVSVAVEWRERLSNRSYLARTIFTKLQR